MKYSKVNHLRTGVIQKEISDKQQGRNTMGIIYNYPMKGTQKAIRLQSYTRERERRARDRYTVLIKAAEYEGNRDLCRNISACFNALMARLLKIGGQGMDDTIGRQMAYLKHLGDPGQDYAVFPALTKRKMEKGKLLNVSELNISFHSEQAGKEFLLNFANTYSRKKLRRQASYPHDGDRPAVYDTEVMAELMWLICQGADYERACHAYMTDDRNEKRVKAFLFALNTDYRNENHAERSILLQNNKIQVMETKDSAGETSHRLVLASYVNDMRRRDVAEIDDRASRHISKRFAFEFIRDFANQDEAGQKRMLRQMHSLMKIYYYGPEQDDCFSRQLLVLSDNLKTLNQQIAIKQTADLRGRKKTLLEEMKIKVHEVLAAKYRYALERVLMDISQNGIGADRQDISQGAIEGRLRERRAAEERARYWLQYISRWTEKVFVSRGTGRVNFNERNLSAGSLCRSAYREWLSYIAQQYMMMGKAVYHFAMPDMGTVFGTEPVKMGEILPEFRDGLTSFDYEMIQAGEEVRRDMAVAITFAVNNFTRAVLGDGQREQGLEDLLQIRNRGKMKAIMGTDSYKIYRRLLQFFGGASTWEKEGPGDDGVLDLVMAIRGALDIVRNNSFHYTADTLEDGLKDARLLKTIFKKEYRELNDVYRKKFLDNNVWMFYDETDIKSLMNRLYDGEKERPAQIPAFKRVLKRARLADFMDGYMAVEGRQLLQSWSADDREQYFGAVYFVLKEMYYNLFLQEKDLRERFILAVGQEEEASAGAFNGNRRDPKVKKRYFATKNFSQRVKVICGEDCDRGGCGSFGQLCQQLEIDYNMQNRRKGQDKENLYQHFPMLMEACIRRAFRDWLEDERNDFEFLKRPGFFEDTSGQRMEKFCSEGFAARTFEGLERQAAGAFSADSGQEKDSDYALAWYIAAHFLSPRYLNRLIGAVKKHREYTDSVFRRYRAVCGKDMVFKKADRGREVYGRVLRMLEFAQLFCGRLTAEKTDYFADDNDYVKHLTQYVEVPRTEGAKGAEAPAAFGNGIYFDAGRPIMNKNIVFSRMFGSGNLLAANMTKVRGDEIRTLNGLKKKLAPLFTGKIKMNDIRVPEKKKKDLLLLKRQFINLKNRVELFDIAVYMEIISDLMSQLVGWCFLRERDLMYFQLGFHYLRLYHGAYYDREAFEGLPLRSMRHKGKGRRKINIQDGALLYQICALYTFELPVYGRALDEKGTRREMLAGATANTKRQIFADCCGGLDLLNDGIFLFEKPELQQGTTSHRNFIDHFKYFAGVQRSIMDLYNMTYRDFFNYDQKLRMSVPQYISQAMARYHMGANIRFRPSPFTGEKPENAVVRAGSSFEAVLYTENFTEKYDRELKDRKGAGRRISERFPVPVHSEIFVSDLQKMLNYKHD